ncbi:MAG: arylesterase [Gammaproteobacteria bacterium]|nr:arylesterase [Gammaproteobacteria bacterium]
MLKDSIQGSIYARNKRIILCFVLLLCTFNCIKFAQAKHLLVFGDSLSAAYGMELHQGWVQLMENELGEDYSVSNASISGETTVGGLARLPETLNELQPDIVLLELGANDGLRGYPVGRIKANLSSMIQLIQDSGAIAILAGISVPPSYGPRYVEQFQSIFRQLAEEHRIPFIDFYDQRLVSTPGFIQEDGLHPSLAGQPIIRDLVLEFFESRALLE